MSSLLELYNESWSKEFNVDVDATTAPSQQTSEFCPHVALRVLLVLCTFGELIKGQRSHAIYIYRCISIMCRRLRPNCP